MAKYTIQLDPQLEKTLEGLAQGESKAQVVRRALGLVKYLADAEAKGAEVRIHEPDGTQKQIVFESKVR